MTRNPRAEWFAILAKLCFPADPQRAEGAFIAYLPLLTDLPDEAFTDSSLRHVIASSRKMAIPSFDEVRKPLDAWLWQRKITADQRLGRSEYPTFPTTQRAPRTPPSEVEKHIVGEAVKAWKASREKQRAIERPDAKPLSPAAYLSGDALAQARRSAGIPHIPAGDAA